MFAICFKSLGKAALHLALGNIGGIAEDVLEASAALGLTKEPEEISWLLIYRSFIRAMLALVESNQQLLIKRETLNVDELEIICNYHLDVSLKNNELYIDQKLF